MADVGVGGGASKAFTWAFRNMGDSVHADRPRFPPSLGLACCEEMEVCRDSFGLLGGGGLVDTESIAPATCFRSSEAFGEISLGVSERDGVQEPLLWRLGLGSCERIGRINMILGV